MLYWFPWVLLISPTNKLVEQWYMRRKIKYVLNVAMIGSRDCHMKRWWRWYEKMRSFQGKIRTFFLFTIRIRFRSLCTWDFRLLRIIEKWTKKQTMRLFLGIHLTKVLLASSIWIQCAWFQTTRQEIVLWSKGKWKGFISMFLSKWGLLFFVSLFLWFYVSLGGPPGYW